MADMPASNLLLTALVSVSLAACGGKKDDKKSTEETPDPARQPPTATGPAQGGGSLAMLFGGDKPAAGKPSGGLFGGGLNLSEVGKAAGATASGTAPEADEAPPPAAGKKPADGGPPCAEVAKRVATVAKADLAAADPGLAEQIEPLLTEMCTTMQWSAAARQCVMDARDEAGLEKCNALLPGEGGGMGQRDELEEGDMGDLPDVPMANKPVPSGNAECDAMAANLVTMMMAAGEQIPADARYGVQNMIAEMCAKTPWPKDAVQCLSQARSEQDAEACAARYDLGG